MESDTEVYVVSFSSGHVQSFASMSHDYFARTVREANAGHVEVHCRNDRWVPRGGGITSALRPLLFVVAMDKLTDEVRQEFLWTMMFVDDSDNREEAVLEMVKMSWFYWEGPGWTGLEVRPEGQLRLRCLETKLERRDGTDVCNRGHIGWRMLNMELTGRRKRGRP